jgi:DNA polymerase iota
MDVDCFYCQCECLTRGIPFDRPLAIGQKHIVVTCNYAARQLGVTKLQLREDALRSCPHLLIVEGSDLEMYRVHSRKIYQALRRLCKELHAEVSVAKGSMDEAAADLTPAVADVILRRVQEKDTRKFVYDSSVYIYHDNKESSSDRNVLVYGDESSNAEREAIIRNLHVAAHLAMRIRTAILESTGFSTTLGVSTNPLLSKMGSGIRKPGTVNVLYPWRGSRFVRSRELRTIAGMGSRMVRSLRPCLEAHFPDRPSDFKWRCG